MYKVRYIFTIPDTAATIYSYGQTDLILPFTLYLDEWHMLLPHIAASGYNVDAECFMAYFLEFTMHMHVEYSQLAITGMYLHVCIKTSYLCR